MLVLRRAGVSLCTISQRDTFCTHIARAYDVRIQPEINCDLLFRFAIQTDGGEALVGPEVGEFGDVLAGGLGLFRILRNR